VSDKIYLDFALPQEYAARAQPGMVVMAHAPMLGDEPVRIEVVALDAVANATTRNVRTRAVIDNPDQKLRPGMFVDVITPVDEAREYVAIPATAVRRASFGDHVFVIGPDEKKPEQSRARQRFVKLGAMIGSDVIILEGLEAGEQVAADGSFKLRDGVLVMMGPPPAPASDAAAASGQK
jgi:membrane fusion protein (multidrug efflux system)